MEELLIKHKDEEVATTSFEGKKDQFLGDFLILYNRYTLGASEETVLRSLHAQAMKWMAAEKTLRVELAQGNGVQLKDQVGRSVGLLIHSYQLQTKEALEALSLIKLGIDLRWVEGISDADVNRCFFHCRHAHLCHLVGEGVLEPQELAKKRAIYLHQQLGAMRFTA
jgi:protein arginine kinase